MSHALKDSHRQAIVSVIASNDRVDRAVLFGSRATGTNADYSDVDLVLFGDRLTFRDRARMAESLDRIPMAQTVDLVLYRSISNQALKDHIRDHGVEWYTRPAVPTDAR